MLNHITIHGRLTDNPVLKQTPSGVSVCNFNVAVDRPYKNGEDKITDFFTVVCWRGLAEMASKHFTKGKEILVSGEMQSRKWVDNNGISRVSWEIQAYSVDFCGSKGNTATEENGTQRAVTTPQEAMQNSLDISDDLPF